jgi:hypothetical protein
MAENSNELQSNNPFFNEWIPRVDVMRFLGYRNTQMWNFLKAGKVKTVKIGKRIFVNRKSLNNYLDANSSQSEF